MQRNFFWYTSFCRCFARLQSETSLLHVSWRKCRMCSHSFLPWWPLAFLIFSLAAIKVPCFSSNVIGLLCFLSLALAVSQLSRSMKILKFSGKIESALLLLLYFSLKVRVAMRLTADKHGCLKCKFTPDWPMTINWELDSAKEFREWQPSFIKHFNVLKFHRLLAPQRGVVGGS